MNVNSWQTIKIKYGDRFAIKISSIEKDNDLAFLYDKERNVKLYEFNVRFSPSFYDDLDLAIIKYLRNIKLNELEL